MAKRRNFHVNDGYSSNPKVVMIGTLPPLRGISAYCEELGESLSEIIEFQFISFNKLYPKFLYPGGDERDVEPLFRDPPFEVQFALHGYRPRTWFSVGTRLKADLVHFQWWSPLLFPAYLTLSFLFKIRRKPRVLTIHNVKMHENIILGSLLNRIIIGMSDRIIVHSERNKRILISDIPSIVKKKIDVVPHGILFSNVEEIDKSIAKKIVGLDVDSQSILFFGNIRPYKGLDTLIKACKQIVQIHPNLKLMISGQPWNDWEKYRLLIDESGLSNNCYLNLDYANDKKVATLFQAADLVVLPYTDFDSQSGVGLTAIRFGKPLIVSDVGGLPELVRSQNAIFKPGDTNDLANKISNALSSPELMEELRKDSLEMKDFFKWNNIAKSTVAIYQQILHWE